MDRKSGSHWLGVLLIIVLAAAFPACDQDSRSPESSSGGITVSANSQTLGTYSTQIEAANKASQLAAFQVLPVNNLPEGFAVSFMDVKSTSPGVGSFVLRVVQVGIRSDTGGLLVIQNDTGLKISEDGLVRVSTDLPGKYYSSGDGESLVYYLLTEDRTYNLITRNNLTSDQAVKILSGFLR